MYLKRTYVERPYLPRKFSVKRTDIAQRGSDQLVHSLEFPLGFPMTRTNFYDVTDMLTLLYVVVEFNIILCDFIY